jgi:hypothetical protein
MKSIPCFNQDWRATAKQCISFCYSTTGHCHSNCVHICWFSNLQHDKNWQLQPCFDVIDRRAFLFNWNRKDVLTLFDLSQTTPQYSFDSAAVERLHSIWSLVRDWITWCILSFGWFPGIWILYANILECSVCSIFIGSVSRKNNQDEFVGVFIWKMVWLENSLSQSEGGGRSEYRNRLWMARTPSGGQSKCEGEMALCQSEEEEPLDGRCCVSGGCGNIYILSSFSCCHWIICQISHLSQLMHK